MKKFIKSSTLILVFSFFLCANVLGQVAWVGTNQGSVAWDAVTTLANGDPVPAGDSVSYELFIVSHGSSDRDNDKTLSGETSLLTYTYTFSAEGRWTAGIRAVRTPADEAIPKSFSEIVWSDDDSLSTKFGFMYLLSPGKVNVFVPK